MPSRDRRSQAKSCVPTDHIDDVARGPFGIGQQDAGFAQLHFAADGSLRAVDLVEIEPVSGAGSARRVPIDPEEESDEVVPLAEPSR